MVAYLSDFIEWGGEVATRTGSNSYSRFGFAICGDSNRNRL
jgi:hypothetical protein